MATDKTYKAKNWSIKTDDITNKFSDNKKYATT
jgi:hypothetical protein